MIQGDKGNPPADKRMRGGKRGRGPAFDPEQAKQAWFRCGEKGHWASECLEKRQRNATNRPRQDSGTDSEIGRFLNACLDTPTLAQASLEDDVPQSQGFA